MSELVERLLERGAWSDGGKVWQQDALCAAAATALEAKEKEIEALQAAYACASELLKEAEARAETSERRVAELERNRDHFERLYRRTDTECAAAEAHAAHLQRELADTGRKLEEAREALKPFAKIAVTHPVTLRQIGILNCERDAARAVIEQKE